MKALWTANELIALQVPGMPTTRAAIFKRAEREGWKWQTMPGFGAPRGYEFESLPQPVRLKLAKDELKAKPQQELALMEPAKLPVVSAAGMAGAAKRRLEARLDVLAAFDRFVVAAGITRSRAVKLFAAEYTAGSVEVDAATRAEIPGLGRSTLHDWLTWREQQGAERLALNYRATAQSPIDADPRLRTALLGLYQAYPNLSASILRKTLRDNLPADCHIPSERAILRWFQAWKAQNPVDALRWHDPDAAKSKYQLALGDAAAGIERANQVWQMDASPADVMCVDGRWKLSVIIDIATRRVMVLVTKQPRAIAHLALFRRMALAYGLPELVKTDRGQDYRAREFKLAMAAFAIVHRECKAFSPEMKPFIERFIGTLQHSLMERLPGYVGHNVADAQAIRARAAFSKRLGESNERLYQVELTAVELQMNINRWIETEYHQERHSTLGCAPNEMAAKLGAGLKPVPSERSLDICLMPLATGAGLRVVGKKGLAVDGLEFGASWMAYRMGLQVIVRLDPVDAGVIHCFDPMTHQHIGVAHNLALLGTSRRELAIEAKTAQRTLAQARDAAVRPFEKQLQANRIARAKADGEQYMPETITISMPGAKHRGLEHLRAVTVSEAPALPAPEPEVVEQQPVDDNEVPLDEAAFVAWVLRGKGDARHRQWVIDKARDSQGFAAFYELDEAKLNALESAEARAA